MANQVSGNTIFVDTSGDAITTKVRIREVTLSGSHGSGTAGQLVLKNRLASSQTKFHWYVPDKETVHLIFREPGVSFEDGINVSSISNCKVTLVIENG